MPLQLRQDKDSFHSTHYLMQQQPDGMWYWTLTGTIEIPAPFPHMRYSDGAEIFVTIPGIGSDVVQLWQWAPFLTVNGVREQKTVGCWGVQNFELSNPKELMRMACVRCHDDLTEIRSLGYVVHLAGKILPPPPVPVVT